MNGEADNQIIEQPGVSQPASPWGPWATVGWSLVVAVAVTLVDVAVQMALLVAKEGIERAAGVQTGLPELENSGLFFALATLASAPVCVGLVGLFARIRKGTTVRRYLGVNPLPLRAMIKWLGLVALFMILSDAITSLLGRPTVPEFMVSTYKTSYFAPLLWLAVLVAAPLMEETLFRGFLFEGLRHSRMGVTGAIALTSLVWTAIHFQYDLYELCILFVMGVILGMARSRTDSIYAPIILHSFCNLVAMVQVAFYLAT